MRRQRRFGDGMSLAGVPWPRHQLESARPPTADRARAVPAEATWVPGWHVFASNVIHVCGPLHFVSCAAKSEAEAPPLPRSHTHALQLLRAISTEAELQLAKRSTALTTPLWRPRCACDSQHGALHFTV